MITTTVLLFAAATIASASQLAQLVPIDLFKRDIHSGGGWALSTSTCPVGTATCSSWCCPNSLTCVSTPGGVNADVCCHGTSACTDALKATPFCADSAWTLWNTTSYDKGGGYFCCEQGQQGTDQGDCVDSETVVASTLAAQLLVPGAGNAGTAAATAARSTSASASAAASTTATSTGGGIVASLVSSAKSDLSSVASAISTDVTGHLGSATSSSSAAGSTSSSGAGGVGMVENMGVWGLLGGAAALAAAVI